MVYFDTSSKLQLDDHFLMITMYSRNILSMQVTLRINKGLKLLQGKSIVGIIAQVWHYDTGVVLDGNSPRWRIPVQALRMKEKRHTQVSFDEVAYTRGIADQKSRMHALSWTEKRVHVGKLIFRSMVFGPWYCVRSIKPRYWVPSIGSLWFWTMV